MRSFHSFSDVAIQPASHLYETSRALHYYRRHWILQDSRHACLILRFPPASGRQRTPSSGPWLLSIGEMMACLRGPESLGKQFETDGVIQVLSLARATMIVDLLLDRRLTAAQRWRQHFPLVSSPCQILLCSSHHPPFHATPISAYASFQLATTAFFTAEGHPIVGGMLLDPARGPFALAGGGPFIVRHESRESQADLLRALEACARFLILCTEGEDALF